MEQLSHELLYSYSLIMEVPKPGRRQHSFTSSLLSCARDLFREIADTHWTDKHKKGTLYHITRQYAAKLCIDFAIKALNAAHLPLDAFLSFSEEDILLTTMKGMTKKTPQVVGINGYKFICKGPEAPEVEALSLWMSDSDPSSPSSSDTEDDEDLPPPLSSSEDEQIEELPPPLSPVTDTIDLVDDDLAPPPLSPTKDVVVLPPSPSPVLTWDQAKEKYPELGFTALLAKVARGEVSATKSPAAIEAEKKANASYYSQVFHNTSATFQSLIINCPWLAR